jgi:PEP-CTERM/exosortase A-associated glycosyltransferase
MKILHVLDHSLPIYDGYTFRSRNIFGCQVGVGMEPIVVTSPKHEADWKGEWAPEEEIDGVRYFRSGAVPRNGLPFADEMRLMGALERRIRKVAERERPDVLHAHSPILNAIPALRVGKQLGIPVVYEIRAFWEDAAADQGSYAEGSFKYRLVRYLETRVCRRAQRVVPICQGLLADLRGRGIPDARLTVIPNAVVPEQFADCTPDEDLRAQWGLAGRRVVGFVGSFYHFEGLDLLVDAAARLAQGFPDLALVLVGGGEMEGALAGQVRRLGLQDRVVMPGRIPHDRVPGVYGLIDLLVYPRKPMRLTELVTPLKPLEAMAMGKALVASDVGGHRELVTHGETGVLFPAGDVVALAECAASLLADSDRRAALGGRGLEWVRAERSWQKNGPRYREVYAGLLSDVDQKYGGATAAAAEYGR